MSRLQRGAVRRRDRIVSCGTQLLRLLDREVWARPMHIRGMLSAFTKREVCYALHALHQHGDIERAENPAGPGYLWRLKS